MVYSDELYHHGIKGQKWGVRRFQNRDGSYTSRGERRRRGGSTAGSLNGSGPKPIGTFESNRGTSRPKPMGTFEPNRGTSRPKPIGTFEPNRGVHSTTGKKQKQGLAIRMLNANGKRYRARLEKEMDRMQKKKKYQNADRKDRNFQAAAARRMAVRSVLNAYATYKIAKLAYNTPKYIRFARKVKRVVNDAHLMNASMNVVMEQFPDGSTRFV